MDIKKEDVLEISEVGELYGDKVKMIKTHGGLHVIVGKKQKNSRKPDPLAVGSHRALAVHQLEKMYGEDFRPSIMKSEQAQTEQVRDFPVSDALAKNHLEIQSIAKSGEVDFVVSRFGIVLAKYECEIANNQLSIKKYTSTTKASDTLSLNKEEIAVNMKNSMSSFLEDLNIGFKF